jgi:hypothetical protein
MNKLLSFLFLVTFLNAKAQNVTIKWIEELEQKRGFGGLPASDEALSTEDGGSIRLENKYKGLFYKLEEQNLIKVSKTGKIEKTKVFGEKEMEEGILSTLVKLKNSYTAILYKFDKEKKGFEGDLIIKDLEPKTLVVTKERFKLGFKMTDGLKISYSLSPESDFVIYSPDSSYAVIQITTTDKKAKTKNVNFIRLNVTEDPILIKGKSWGDDYMKITVNQPSIDNNGIIFSSYNVFEKDCKESYYTSQSTPNSAYQTFFTRFSKNEVHEMKLIENEHKFFNSTNIIFQSKGREKMLGTYKNTFDGRIAGLYYTIPQGEFDQKIMYLAFPDSLLARVENDKQGRATGKDIGLDDAFIVKDIISLDNSETCIFMQFSKVSLQSNVSYDAQTQRTNQRSYIEVEQGDFLICILSPNGQVKYQLIKHNQKTADPLSNSDKNKLIVFENKLLLFYYDDPDNFNIDESKKVKQLRKLIKADFVFLIMDKKANIIEKKLIYNIKDEDYLLPLLKFNNFEKNRYSIVGYEPTFLGAKIKKGILTIK